MKIQTLLYTDQLPETSPHIPKPSYISSEDFGSEEFPESPSAIVPTSNEEYIPFADIEKKSSLASTLRQIYDDIYSYGIVDVFINDCIQVGFCVDPCHNPSLMPIGDIENIDKILQSYHTLLFFEDCVPGPDSNPYVLRFFEHYELERSLHEISHYSRMPLQQVSLIII